MKYPGYLLNPGDMFQVDVEKVMYATGRKKLPTTKLSKRAPKSVQNAEAEGEAAAEEAVELEAAVEQEAEELDEEAKKKKTVKNLTWLRDRAKKIVESSSDLSVKRKRALRALMRDAKTTWSKLGANSDKLDEADAMADNLAKLLSELEVSPAETQKVEVAEAKEVEETSGVQSKEESKILRRLIQEELENPEDLSKPYATPWKPRPYMSAFAFIPRYLEVNQNICAAVYLRHPVARQGLAEVPTPFSKGLNQLAFNWYLRRG